MFRGSGDVAGRLTVFRGTGGVAGRLIMLQRDW